MTLQNKQMPWEDGATYNTGMSSLPGVLYRRQGSRSEIIIVQSGQQGRGKEKGKVCQR